MYSSYRLCIPQNSQSASPDFKKLVNAFDSTPNRAHHEHYSRPFSLQEAEKILPYYREDALEEALDFYTLGVDESSDRAIIAHQFQVSKLVKWY